MGRVDLGYNGLFIWDFSLIILVPVVLLNEGEDAMWVIDIRSWLVEKETESQDSALKDKVEKVREIITHATGSAAEKPAESPPVCWRKFEGNPCRGKLVTRLDEGTDQIYWKCPVCQDEGVITGWRGIM